LSEASFEFSVFKELCFLLFITEGKVFASFCLQKEGLISEGRGGLNFRLDFTHTPPHSTINTFSHYTMPKKEPDIISEIFKNDIKIISLGQKKILEALKNEEMTMSNLITAIKESIKRVIELQESETTNDEILVEIIDFSEKSNDQDQLAA
jgi:hypothetical protein